jgi:hypothetical protein
MIGRRRTLTIWPNGSRAWREDAKMKIVLRNSSFVDSDGAGREASILRAPANFDVKTGA